MSPTVFRSGPYRFFFYSNENSEPPHVHIRGSGSEAKYWLEPVVLAYNYGYRGHELRYLEELVVNNKEILVRAWNEHASRK